ncbi:hypothetical protein OH492_11385 [Vibrio chagasii]|nr:hypothetical protein [Vibrio chagasii]
MILNSWLLTSHHVVVILWSLNPIHSLFPANPEGASPYSHLHVVG